MFLFIIINNKLRCFWLPLLGIATWKNNLEKYLQSC